MSILLRIPKVAKFNNVQKHRFCTNSTSDYSNIYNKIYIALVLGGGLSGAVYYTYNEYNSKAAIIKERHGSTQLAMVTASNVVYGGAVGCTIGFVSNLALPFATPIVIGATLACIIVYIKTKYE